MKTAEAAEKWNCTPKDVAQWCKQGLIPGAEKPSGPSAVRPWAIPDDAKRPIDRRLQREIIWRIIERKNDPGTHVDLTAWGIADEDVPGCLHAMMPILLRKGEPDAGIIGSVDELRVTEAGFRLVNRHGAVSANDAPAFLTWSANFAGTFAGAFVSSLARLPLD